MTRLLILCLWCGVASGANWLCPDASFTMVNSNVQLHAVSGDIVSVPSGNVVWSSNLLITNRIQLLSTGSTFVTNGVSGNNPVITLSPSTVGPFPVMTLNGFGIIDTLGTANNGVITYAGLGVRICSNNINTAVCAIMGYGFVYSSIDHNWFGPQSGSEIQNIGDTNAWSMTGPTFGTTNFAFAEDNIWYFTGGFGDGAIDTYNGANYVFQHNMVTNTYVGHHGCDSGGFRSTHACDVNHNVFVWLLPGNEDVAMQSRGGSSLYHDNLIIGTFNTVFKFQNYRCCDGTSLCATSLFGCPPWGSMTGSNPIDGNTDGFGYPGLDQIGRTGPTTFGVSSSTQTLAPVYCWNNSFSGSLAFGWVSADPTVIQQNRDYYTNTPFAYTPLYPNPLVQSSFPNPQRIAQVQNFHAGIAHTGP